MNSRKKFKFRLPHAFTLLFAIVIFFGILSLILQWSGVNLSDGSTVEGYTVTTEMITELQNNTNPAVWKTLVESKDPTITLGSVIEPVVTDATPIIGAGILAWFTAVPFGIVNAIWIIVFLFVLGGFINVVVKSQALEAMIGKLSKYFPKNYKVIPEALKVKSPISYYLAKIKEGLRQTWIIIPLMFFFSFCGSTYGMAEETLAFYAIIIPLALAAGFDVWTGFLIIFIGCGAGVMGSTVNPFSIGAAVDASKMGNVTDGIAWRLVGWIVITFSAIIFTMWYALRVKRNKNKSEMKDLFVVHNTMFKTIGVENAPKLTKRRIATGVIFFLTFIIMVLGMLQYDLIAKNITGNDNTPMADVETELSESSIGNIITNSKVIDTMGWQSSWKFGEWYMGTLAAYFLIISIILTLINDRSESRYIETMVVGAKDMLGVAFAVGIAAAIPVILKATHLETLFANGLSNTLKSIETGKEILVPALAYILFMPLTFIIPSTSGLASATFGTIATAFKDTPELLSGTITGYAWGAGLANMVVPTYGVVIGALLITKIPFDKFIKAIIKPLGILFITGLVMIVIGGVIAMYTTSKIF